MKGRGLMHTIVTQPCMKCDKQSIVEISNEQYQRFFVKCESVQDVFSDWPPEKRELLVSGTHSGCWNAMFGEDDIDDTGADDVFGSPPNDNGGIDSGTSHVQGYDLR